MAIKLEAAFHEAAHAVLAHTSQFHEIIFDIDLGQYGSGQLYVMLQRSKLLAKGKTADESAQYDKDVATELALILCAGLVAERIAAARMDGLSPNPSCAINDHTLMKSALKMAGLSEDIAEYEAAVEKVLMQGWPIIQALANHLFDRKRIDAIEAHDFIDRYLEEHPIQ